jgi:DNA-binding MarR family transcriptional regulator
MLSWRVFFSIRRFHLIGIRASDRMTLAAALKPLVRRGLAKVTINPADKRNRSRMGTSGTKSRQSRQCYFG